jgi:hypothetical protein
MHDARREAFDRVGGRFDVRVLEPSPPAILEGPWYADDPVAIEPRDLERPLVSPVPGGDLTWDQLARDEPVLRDWCADRWLGAWRRLQSIADLRALSATRVSWHVLAEHVVAAARHRANGKIGLRFTRDGFGTPFFAESAGSPRPSGPATQVRIEGAEIVVVCGDDVERAEISTPAAAGRMVGVEPGAPREVFPPTTELHVDALLIVDAGSGRLLSDWFGFTCSLLETLRAEARSTDTRTQLWPEHFDLSIELGDQAARTRGTFGASPGDREHPEPYLYVTHWSPDTTADPFWNDEAFAGASLPYRDLLEVDDQRGAALAFFRNGLRVLSGG